MLGPELVFTGRTEVLHAGRRYAFFGGNDYHRFSTHPEVVRALCDTAREYGISSAGSRMTTANHPLYLELEAELARFLGAEAAVLGAAGYLSNTVAVQAVAVEFSRLFLEEQAHPSLSDAARQSGLPVSRFRSRDPEALAARLASDLAPGDRPLVLCDGVAPGTGHLSPLSGYVEVLDRYSGGLLVDDAHAAGVIGRAGRGSWEEAGVPREALVQTGTLSKAFGASGGWVAGSRELVRNVVRHSAAFVGSTPPPLPVIGAALRALRLLEAEPERISRLRERALSVKARLRDAGFPVSAGAAPILSITLGDTGRNQDLGRRLEEAGIYPSFLNYPGAPAGGHFRFTLSSEHTAEPVERLAAVLLAAEPGRAAQAGGG